MLNQLYQSNELNEDGLFLGKETTDGMLKAGFQLFY